MEHRPTAALFVFLIHSRERWGIEVAPLERPEIIGCRMAVGFSAVYEHTIACVQLIGLPLVGKIALTRQNDKAKKRHQILSLRYMRVNSLQRADLLQMEQRCPGKG